MIYLLFDCPSLYLENCKIQGKINGNEFMEHVEKFKELEERTIIYEKENSEREKKEDDKNKRDEM